MAKDGLGLYLKDLYPNFTGTDTGINATPNVDDQDAMNEDVTISEKASVTESSSRNIWIGVAILIALVVFFGAGGRG